MLDTIFTVIYLFLLTIFIILFIIAATSRLPIWPGKRICIVVLGDVGRSPRMQFHSISCANHGFLVDVIAFSGTIPHKDFTDNRNIHVHPIGTFPESKFKGVPKIFLYVIKVIWLSAYLFITMVKIHPPQSIIVQNPPAIPSIAVAYFISCLRGSDLIIDWHNYGYTILSLAVGRNNILVKFSKLYEGFLGRLSTANLCVTNAMKDDLLNKWDINAVTLYDKPPKMFKKSSVHEQHELLRRLCKDYAPFGDPSDEQKTVFTTSQDGKTLLRDDRPALVVSGTSWTEDEDFSMLLNALQIYQEAAKSDGKLPKLLCAITGKGPQKSMYQDKISKIEWTHVSIVTPWLLAEDYPKLLGSADLGISLHTSSSGFDLPMKVVDMFGCGLPVCAVNFPCLHELVKHEVNGLVFDSANELATQMQDLLYGFPADETDLKKFRENLSHFQADRWDANWDRIVLPVLKHEEHYEEH